MTRSSTRSSSGYASCHLEWGRSRQLALILGLLGVLATAALFASDLPREWALMGTPLVLAYAARAALREWQRPRCSLVLPPLAPEDSPDEPAPALLDGIPLAPLEVVWRGRVGFLRGRVPGGRLVRTVFWPDVIPAPARRELRLALRERATSPSRSSMAP